MGRALAAQEAALARHEQMLGQLRQDVAALTLAVAQLIPLEGNAQPGNPQPPSPAPQAAPPAVASGSSPRVGTPSDGPLPTPEPFSGESDKCAGFLAQVSLTFRELQRFHSNDGAKITYLVQLLRGRALKWAQVVLNSDPVITYADFLSKFKNVFNPGTGAEAAALRLLNFKQGRRSMSEYAIDFWILAEEAGWNQEALRSTLLNNIREELRDELIMRDLPASFNELMSLCIKVDERLRARRQTRNSSSQEAAGSRGAEASADYRSSRTPEGADGEVQPMQIGSSHLTAAERQRLITAGACLYCGNKGHMIASCPSRAKGRARQ